jgi:DnaJ-class molecular chaperone
MADNQQGTKLNPGDVAKPGTPANGEAPCPECQGKGQVNGQRCRNCDGTGIVTQGVAGG